MNDINLNKFGVYIWTSNKQMHCVPAWAYLFNKFWPFKQNVRVLGYDELNFELPSNFEYISLGEQRGPKFWSDDMKNYFMNCEHEAFYLVPEDALLVEHVDKEILTLAIKIALFNPDDKFLRFSLTADVQRRSHDTLKVYDNFDLVELSQHEVYRHSLQQSIWSKEKFLEKMIPNQSPWDFELDNDRSRNDGLKVYGTNRKYCIHSTNVYKKGKKLSNWYECGHKQYTDHKGLDKDVIDHLEENGWVKEI